MKVEQIFQALEQVSHQNFLTIEESKSIIEEAVKKAFYAKYDPDAELELKIDKANKQFQLINHSKLVVLDEDFFPSNRPLEIALSEAHKIKPDIQINEKISEEVDFSVYAQTLANFIRQMFTQKVRERKKEVIYDKYKSLKGQIISVIASSITQQYSIFTLEDGTIAFMPAHLRNDRIKISSGQRTEVFVEDVLKESKDAQIIVSNGSKNVVQKILEFEVPEINQGIVEVVSIARIPGVRSKVAVKSTSSNVDPVGAIIGERGRRILTIIEKLQGEKIDIIEWSDNENLYAANALSPAKPISVIDKNNETDSGNEIKPNSKIVITPSRHQTLAIGKGGSNVKLATELTGLHLDVISIDQAKEKNIEIVWNTGITQEDVLTIESGEKIKRVSKKGFNQSSSHINNLSMDSDIESFTNQIREEKVTSQNYPDFKNDNEISLSEEELKAMEANFESDPELDNFQQDYEDEDF